MKWYSYLICSLLICLGVFSLVRLTTIMKTESADYGTVITIETKNDYNEVSKFDFGYLDFTTSDKKTFSTMKSYAPEDFDGTAGNYVLLFDGNLSNNTQVINGSIRGTFDLSFYGVDGEKLSTVKLNVEIIYTATETKVLLSIDNVDDSVSYLTVYTELNGAVFKVVERSV